MSLLFLDILTKKLQKKFAKVNSYSRINHNFSRSQGKKVLRKIIWNTLINGQTGQSNTQKYQFYQQKKHT